MASICHNPIQGNTMRVTRLGQDGCCSPVEGDCSTVVSEGFVSVAMTDNVEAPTEIKQLNAQGIYCYPPVRTQPQLNWIELTIQFCQVDPELFELVTGSPLVLDANGDAVGFGTDNDTYATGRFALEVWTNLGGSAACVDGERFGYLLLPCMKEGTFGDLTIENGPINFTVNAVTNGFNDWGVGPYDVVLDGAGLPSPLLSPIPTQRQRQWQVVDLAPPASSCGCQPLIIPSV
jgi:hypothetical protein